MAHIVQVDQSGKVEDTKVPTVLAFSNGITFSLIVLATDKRECLRVLRQFNLTGKSFYLRIFTILLFLLLKEHIQSISYIIIDHEYLGKEAQIKQQLLELFRKHGITNFSAHNIQFEYIGKESSAHITAYSTFKGDRIPDKKITKEQILDEFKEVKGTKKIGDPLRGRI